MFKWYGIFLLISFYLPALAWGFIDRNCEKLIQEKGYVKGSLVPLRKTERQFQYSKILADFKHLQTEINTSEVSSQCMGKKLEACASFKDYCLENVLVEGLQEDFKKWGDAVKRCSDLEYLRQYPKHCTLENERSLRAVEGYAVQFGVIAEELPHKNMAFLEKARNKFSPLKDKLEELLKQKEQEEKREGDLSNIQNLLARCQGVVTNDDNDVKGRNIATNLFQGLDECRQIGQPLDTTGAHQLQKDMAKISLMELSKNTLPGVLDEALDKGLKGFWSTHLSQKGAIHPDKVEFTCSHFPLLCKTIEGREKVSVVAESFEASIKDEEIPVLSSMAISEQLINDFTPLINDFNQQCSVLKKKYQETDQKYSCTPKMDYKNKEEWATKKIVPVSNLECDERRYKWYGESLKLQGNYSNLLKKKYSEILGSKLGHLFLTDTFQYKVGLFGEDDTFQKCMKGPGKAFGLPNMQDVQKSMSEFYDLTAKEVLEVSKDRLKPKNFSSEILKKYLKSHYLTISQFLYDHPDEEHALAICQAIRSINATENSEKVFTNVMTGVGVVSAVALSVTGVGAPAAPLLLTALGGSTFATGSSQIYQYIEAGKESRSTASAASTDQIELETAIEKIMKTNKEADDQLESFIILVASEATGLAALNSLKLFNKLKSSTTLVRILRGKQAGKTALEMKDLAQIKKGLETLKAELQVNGVSTKSFNALTPTDMAELGARVSKMTPAEIKTIFSGLNKADKSPALARLFLNELRKGPVDLKKLNLLLETYSDLKFPSGQSISGYIKTADKIILDSKPRSFIRLGADKIVGAGKGIRNYGRNYAKEFKESPGFWIFRKRLIIKSRDATLKRGFWKKAVGYLNNPIATFRNSTWEVTTPVSILGYSLLFEKPLDMLKEKSQGSLLEMIEKDKESLAGGEFAWDLMESGLVDPNEMVKIFKNHDTDFNNWYLSKNPKDLPRLKRLQEILNLNDDEVSLISQLAWDTHESELVTYRKSEDRGSKEAKSAFNEKIVQELQTRLKANPSFSRFSDLQRELLATAYYPVIASLTGRDDVELTAALIQTDQPKMKRIFDLLPQGLSLGQGLFMANENLEGSDSIVAQKIKKAQETLPVELQKVADRMDLPAARKELSVKESPGGSEVILNDELDRWKLLATDERLKDGYDLFKNGKIGEVQAMDFVDAAVESFNDIYDVIELRKTKKTVDREMASKILNNPLLSSIAEELDKLVSEKQWTEELAIQKGIRAATVWLDYHEQLAAKKHPEPATFYDLYQKAIQ